MIPRDCEPISHVSPYRRVGMHDPLPVTPAEPETALGVAIREALEVVRAEKAAKIWTITRQVAEGCNQPTRPAEQSPLPEEWFPPSCETVPSEPLIESFAPWMAGHWHYDPTSDCWRDERGFAVGIGRGALGAEGSTA